FFCFFFFQAEDGIRDFHVTGVQTCALPIYHNTFNHVSEGQFGLFECINDQSVANKLLDTAAEWVKSKGGTRIVGPINLTTNDTRSEERRVGKEGRSWWLR